MNEKQTVETTDSVSNSRNRSSHSLVSWVVMLSNVLLFASCLNCLFIWLAYGRPYDAAAMILSSVLALVVYFFALDAKRNASYSSRVLIATSALMLWAILMPVVMKLAGFQSF